MSNFDEPIWIDHYKECCSILKEVEFLRKQSIIDRAGNSKRENEKVDINKLKKA